MNIRPYRDHTPVLGARVFVDPTALVLGEVTVGDDSSIWPMVAVRGDVHRICIGARTNIQDGSVLHVTQANRFTPAGFPLTVGSDVTVGHRVVLHGCTVADGSLIGMGAVVLDGAIIHSRVLLGAGSVVPPGKVLEGGYLWLGSPAKKIRVLTADELAYLEYSPQHYVDLKDLHLRQL